ncbi:protein RIC-3 isoform X2 [Rhineura floridana]|uniref:protein RIC-3 isoform X2 n=1 Tax=Rhineura floridana TaxID=261503 RepID=UPI002AC87F02|nr:protein RIC-3 isoform X2 [Rhineura floridana]
MAYSTFRKVALASCLVLCVSLLLPKVFLSRGWRQPEPRAAASPTLPATPEGKTSQFPPTVHPQMSPEIRPPVTHFPRSHLAEAVAKAKGAVGGGGSGGGGNNGRGLVGQVIPIYGFGILLYILYILFKLSSKGKSSTVAGKCPSSSGNTNRKIMNDDLAAGCEKDRHARFSDQSGTSQNFEKCSCCHYEEDNPAVIAENEGFYYDSCSETEEAAKEERLVDSDHEKAVPKEQNGGNMDEISILRKRNPKGVELLGH